MAELSDDQIKQIINDMTMDRGFVINSFAQIECLLADLIDQCRQFDAYTDLTKVIPFSANNRVATVRSLLVAGPLEPFADQIVRLLTRFMEFEEIRHLFSHGFASVRHTPDGDCGMFFTRYVPPKKGEDAMLIQEFYRPRTMAAQRESSAAFTQDAMAELRKIYLAVGLNPDRLADPYGS